MRIVLPALLFALIAAAACDPAEAKTSKRELGQSATVPAPSSEEEVNPRLLRRFQALPPPAADRRNLVDLGRRLYFEKRLSKNANISCNSCHTLAEYGVDHRVTSPGTDAKLGTRNSPTVYNAAGHFAQFWDGRAASVEDQAIGPISNPDEMRMSPADLLAVLSGSPSYRTDFAATFPGSDDPITVENVGKAIGAFERGLVTPGRWDDYLRGDKDALTPEERRGLRTFLNSGCMVCHTGAWLGGSMFERVGVVEPWPNQADVGRENVTKAKADRMTFKVPSLRNVEKTAPYFHDGSAATLEEAVHMMGKHQLGLDLGADEVGSIVTWLKTLTGPLPPAEYIAAPQEAR